MAASRKVNLAVVGLGYWGPNLVRNFHEIENCRVAMACDANEARLAVIKRRYPHLQTTTKYADLVGERDIDAIAIATPVDTHFGLARQALEHGKHVLVEKPLCTTVAEGEELVRIAQRCSKILMVDHTFLYAGAVRKAKELIAKSEIGDVYYFDSVRINLGLFRPDVNVMWDLAPHDISIAQYLLGEEPVAVSVLGRDFGDNKIACIAYMTLNYPSGVIAHIQVSWLSPVKIRRIIIGGSKKMIIYDDVEPTEKIRVYDSGVEFDYTKETPLQPTYRLGDINMPRLDQREPLFIEAGHFVDCILNGKRPLTDAAFGLSVSRVLEAGDVSLKEGGREVRLKGA